MSEAMQTSGEPTAESNGRHVGSEEPITHEYDRVGHIVLAECCVCCTSGGRRLVARDYNLQEDFKQPLAEGDNYWVPASIYRRCDECGKETTHFVC